MVSEKCHLRWDDGGRGSYTYTPVADNTIMDLVALTNGSIAFGAGGPAFGMLDKAGKSNIFVLPSNATIATIGKGSASPATVALSASATSGRVNPQQLLTLTPEPYPRETGSHPAATPHLSRWPRHPRWDDTFEPKLNGAPLKLRQFENLAHLPSQWTKAHLFSVQHGACTDSTAGRILWEAPVPSVVWAVNVAGNNKVLLAAFGDGTIRWYRMSDGKELLAFFPHADRKRWILWTPSGYYDASVGGEDLIGWHVNRGKEHAADFFPASRFRNTYYRPDVVAMALTSLDEAEAVRLADTARGGTAKIAPIITKILPPVIEILDPADGNIDTSSQTLTLSYRVRTQTMLLSPLSALWSIPDRFPRRNLSCHFWRQGCPGINRNHS